MGRELAMFPLGMVVFPHQVVGLCVFEARYHHMLEDIEAEQRFGTCLITKGAEVGGHEERTAVGTVLQVLGSSVAAQRADAAHGGRRRVLRGDRVAEGRPVSSRHGGRTML